ncbi:threonine/serine exporter [Clostridium botulinum]|uniref:threonine/serine exporter family protein n=1 Tax=Clostridium botulinum TaxID=1491 RepID=UPI001375EEB0|nr:threonine/serine exporter family protein [Clostridium botulinum]MCC5418156.1 threonine/serine exporter family protein [Clostridium botulinum]NCI22513.1 threonine/serine exporter family protein [Clostridium botulinum]NCI36979.1 threonine/serine exporter family protein [Clostridium botulinum]NCI74655.1 threonine/serine exporter family protein [Clostridium botulinum]NDI40776.1 threonine/serine exporter family protein [Clostridium botulinum]
MNINKIIKIAAEAGKIILESGGETYRVEETMSRICSAYNIEDSDNYVTPTVIMISATNGLGQTVSLNKRITSRTIDLDKIDKVNNLSRSIKENNLTLEEVEKELNIIKRGLPYSNTIGILSSCFISSFFTLLFGGNYLDFIIAFIIGAALKPVLSFLSYLNVNVFFTNLVGGFTVSLIALLSTLVISGLNVDKIIIGSVMILVPGIGIVNALRDTIAGDLISGIIRGAEAFLIAVAIAVGTGVVLKLWIYLGGTTL